jgi:hypothetical protein
MPKKTAKPHAQGATIMQYWSAKASQRLKGQTIVDAEYRKNDDGGIELWIFLSGGIALIPLTDDEGNGPGALEIVAKDGQGDVLPQLRDGDDVRPMPSQGG